MLLSTSMQIIAPMGKVGVPVRQLLELGPGSVIQLDKQAGEPVDITLRGVKFAEADLLVVGDQLGVRIRRILSPP